MIYAPEDVHFRDCSLSALIGALHGRIGYDETRRLIAESGGVFTTDYRVNMDIVRLWWAGWKVGDL